MDDLYGLPFDEFVPARDARAKELRAAGDRAAADEVKKLAKPTRAAWAVNTAVRANPAAAEALSESVLSLEEAQRELLAGGDAAALRQATERARAAIDELVAAAPAGSEATAAKVRETLFAALVDPEALAEVRAGRVLRERIASGFGGLAGPLPTRKAAKAAPRKAAVPPRDDAAAKRAARDEARRQEKLRRAKEAEAAAEHEVTAARVAFEQVESALAKRRAELRAAEDRLEGARRRRERAETG